MAGLLTLAFIYPIVSAARAGTRNRDAPQIGLDGLPDRSNGTEINRLLAFCFGESVNGLDRKDVGGNELFIAEAPGQNLDAATRMVVERFQRTRVGNTLRLEALAGPRVGQATLLNKIG